MSNTTGSVSLTQQIKQIDIKEALDKRFCDLAFSLLGKDVSVKLAQEKQEGKGIFYTMNPSAGGVILKNYRSCSSTDGEAAVATPSVDSTNPTTKILNRSDFMFLFAENIEDPPFVSDLMSLKSKQAFRTDTEILGKEEKDQQKGRTLQAVDFLFAGGNGARDFEKLQPSGEISRANAATTTKKFDQFEVNQERFGVGKEFHDEFYTTKLDYSKLDKEQIANAERIENQVIQEASSNKHVLIDRGRHDLLAAEESDEEKDFSAVHGSGRYTEEIKRRTKQQEEQSNNNNNNSDLTFGRGKPSFTSKDKETKKEVVPPKVSPVIDSTNFPSLSSSTQPETKKAAVASADVITRAAPPPAAVAAATTTTSVPASSTKSPTQTATTATPTVKKALVLHQDTSKTATPSKSNPQQEQQSKPVSVPSTVPSTEQKPATTTATKETVESPQTTNPVSASQPEATETTLSLESKASSDQSGTEPVKKKLQLKKKPVFVEKSDSPSSTNPNPVEKTAKEETPAVVTTPHQHPAQNTYEQQQQMQMQQQQQYMQYPAGSLAYPYTQYPAQFMPAQPPFYQVPMPMNPMMFQYNNQMQQGNLNNSYKNNSTQPQPQYARRSKNPGQVRLSLSFTLSFQIT